MTFATQPKKRIKVTFPQPMFDQLVADVPPRKRSAFIVRGDRGGAAPQAAQLEPDSPLYQDMAEILQRKEQGDVKLHSHAEVWGE